MPLRAEERNQQQSVGAQFVVLKADTQCGVVTIITPLTPSPQPTHPHITPCTTQVAVVPVDASSLSSSKPQVPLGPVVAAGQVLAAKGYAPAYVLAPEFNALSDDTAKAK